MTLSAGPTEVAIILLALANMHEVPTITTNYSDSRVARVQPRKHTAQGTRSRSTIIHEADANRPECFGLNAIFQRQEPTLAE